MDTIPPMPGPIAPPPPPPPITPPPPAKKRGSRGWMVVAILAFLMLGVSLMFNFGALFSSLAGMDGGVSSHAGLKLDEVLTRDEDSRNKIAIVPVEGIISSAAVDGGGHTMVEVIQEQLDRAADDKRVKAVILKVDSPGGEVLASDEINRAIVNFQKETGKPVVASMGGLAASGGYYVSAPCRFIMAHEMTITGSIGVIISTWNYRSLMSKVGVSPYTFKSGEFKDMLSGQRAPEEIPAGEREMVQGLINETYQKFKSIVSEGRTAAAKKNKNDGKQLAENWQKYADGRILTGREALELGFVDALGNFDDAVEQTLKLADIEDANLIEYRMRHDLAELFRLFGKAETRSVKLDLGMDFPKLEAGRPYFLYLP